MLSWVGSAARLSLFPRPGACVQVPLFRVLLNNWAGLAIHVLYMAW